MSKHFLLSFGIVVLSALGVLADEESDYNAAVDQWLAGEEEVPLTTLSALANGGYVDAQILLAQIEHSSSFNSDFVLGLSRKERIALLRQPIGLSGKSWLEASAETSGLASALLASKSAETRFAAIIDLYELGEHRIADDAFIAQLNYGYEPIFEIAGEQTLPDAMVPNVTMLARIATEVSEPYMSKMTEHGNFRQLTPSETAKALYQLSPYFYRIVSDNPDYPDFVFGHVVAEMGASADKIALFDSWIMDHPMFDVLRSPCERVCPNDVAACTRAAYFGIPLRETMALGSPAESLIPHQRYIGSQRAVQDMIFEWVNRVTDARPIPNASACFAELVEVERAKRN